MTPRITIVGKRIIAKIDDKDIQVARFCDKRRVFIMFQNAMEYYRPDLISDIRLYTSKRHHDDVYELWHYPVCSRVYYKNGIIHSEFLMNRRWKTRREKINYFNELFETVIADIKVSRIENINVDQVIMVVYERKKFPTRLSFALDEHMDSQGYVTKTKVGSMNIGRNYMLYATKFLTQNQNVDIQANSRA